MSWPIKSISLLDMDQSNPIQCLESDNDALIMTNRKEKNKLQIQLRVELKNPE